MSKNPLNLSLAACLLFLCLTARSQFQKLYLNPKAAGNAKQTDFVDSIRFFPLEQPPNISPGANMGIDITQDYFLLIDFPKKNLFLYNKAGRLVKTVSFKHLGNEFYPEYIEERNQIVFLGRNKNFSLTPKDAISIEINWNNPKNRKYYRKYVIDLGDTTFALKKMLPEQHEITRAVHYYDDRFLNGKITTSNLYKDSLDYEVKIIHNNNIIKGYFPYNRIKEPRFSYTQAGTYFSKTDTPYIRYVSRPFCDTIYKLVKDSLYVTCQLVLPMENKLPADFYSRSFKSSSDRTNFERNNAMLFRQAASFFETPKAAYITIRYLSNYGSYIYNKETNTTYKAANIKADTTQYNLQLIAEYGNQRRNGSFFKLIRAKDLQTFFQQHKDAVPPPELKAFLQGNPSPESPVIVSFKLKN